jgi:hypothetical protein
MLYLHGRLSNCGMAHNAIARRFRRKVSYEMQVRLPAQITHAKNARPWRSRRAGVPRSCALDFVFSFRVI